MNTEEIELNLDDVWEEIDLYVKLCGGDPSMVTTDHNKLAARKDIEDAITTSYHSYASEAFQRSQAEFADTEDLTARGELKERLASLLQALKCKQTVDATVAVEIARAEELIA